MARRDCASDAMAIEQDFCEVIESADRAVIQILHIQTIVCAQVELPFHWIEQVLHAQIPFVKLLLVSRYKIQSTSRLFPKFVQRGVIFSMLRIAWATR